MSEAVKYNPSWAELHANTIRLMKQAEYTMELQEPPPELDQWELLDQVEQLDKHVQKHREWEIQARELVGGLRTIIYLMMRDELELTKDDPNWKTINEKVDRLLIGDNYDEFMRLSGGKSIFS